MEHETFDTCVLACGFIRGNYTSFSVGLFKAARLNEGDDFTVLSFFRNVIVLWLIDFRFSLFKLESHLNIAGF